MSVPYHRLFRVHPRYRWWRPLVALAIFLGFYLVSQVLIAVGFFVPILVHSGVEGLQDFATTLQDDALSSSDPLVLGLTLASLVLLLPAIMWAVKLARLGPFGQLSSVRLRIRWGWMARCLLPLLVLAVLMVGIQAFLGSDAIYVIDGSGVHPNTAAIGQSTVRVETLVIVLVMVIVLVPFQAAAEEYIFRGFLLQTIGGWIRNPIPAIVVSTVCFAVLHVPNGYNIWGILDVGSFGAIAAILVWRTGGLEAGILAHALNNIVIFVLQAPGWSKIDPDPQGTWVGWLVTLITMGAYWGMVEFMMRGGRLERRRRGTEAPRYRGAPPAWAGTTARPEDPADGWEGVPALATAAPVAAGTAGTPADSSPSGIHSPGSPHSPTPEDGPVGGRP